jgi:hypothetical protein
MERGAIERPASFVTAAFRLALSSALPQAAVRASAPAAAPRQRVGAASGLGEAVDANPLGAPREAPPGGRGPESSGRAPFYFGFLGGGGLPLSPHEHDPLEHV